MNGVVYRCKLYTNNQVAIREFSITIRQFIYVNLGTTSLGDTWLLYQSLCQLAVLSTSTHFWLPNVLLDRKNLYIRPIPMLAPL